MELSEWKCQLQIGTYQEHCQWLNNKAFALCLSWDCTFLVAQMVKRLPTVWETWVQSLGREDTLEKEMATHSSTLAWKMPWTEECGRLQSMGSQRVGHDWATSLSTEIEPLLLQLVTFSNPWGSSGWREALCAPGNLVGQVCRWLDVFRNRFYDLNPCISSHLEKH